MAVILALRQYPQGGDNNINPPIPLSLDGRGIKGEGENDASASSRHCGLDPQSRGEGRGNNKTAPTEYPSPLMGEESKVRETQPQTLGAEGETNYAHPFD